MMAPGKPEVDTATKVLPWSLGAFLEEYEFVKNQADDEEGDMLPEAHQHP